MSKWVAYDIQWDVDNPEDLAGLGFRPDAEIVIPEGLTEDEISDYISDKTGFCHKGFRLKKHDGWPPATDGRKEKACRCGSDRFYAHQVCRMDVIVNADNDFIENPGGDAAAAVYDAGDPYGPYTCVVCGAEYDSLEDLPGEADEKYRCYEDNFEGAYTLSQMRGMYNAIVSKKEYPDFGCWLADMLKSGVFVREGAND